MKTLMASVLVLAFAAPAFGAEFYVVQDMSTKKCTIVDKKPTTTTTTTILGDGKVFTTREEAEAGMKTIKVCTNG